MRRQCLTQSPCLNMREHENDGRWEEPGLLPRRQLGTVVDGAMWW